MPQTYSLFIVDRLWKRILRKAPCVKQVQPAHALLSLRLLQGVPPNLIQNLAKGFWAVRISTSSISLVGRIHLLLEKPLVQKDELRPWSHSVWTLPRLSCVASRLTLKAFFFPDETISDRHSYVSSLNRLLWSSQLASGLIYLSLSFAFLQEGNESRSATIEGSWIGTGPYLLFNYRIIPW